MNPEEKDKSRFSIHSGDRIGGDKITQKGIFSVGVDKRTYISHDNSIEITAIAKEIQDVLVEIEKTHPISDISDKMVVASKAFKQVQNNSDLMSRIYRSLKAGGISALEQALSHPAASFLMNALKEWRESR